VRLRHLVALELRLACQTRHQEDWQWRPGVQAIVALAAATAITEPAIASFAAVAVMVPLVRFKIVREQSQKHPNLHQNHHSGVPLVVAITKLEQVIQSRARSPHRCFKPVRQAKLLQFSPY